MNYWKHSLAILLSLACATLQAASLEDELIAVDTQFFNAVFAKPDPATVERMLAADFTFTSNGKTRTREHFVANLEGMWQQMAQGMRMRRELVKGSARAAREGEVAILTGVQKMYALAGDEEQLVETSEFRRRLKEIDGQWVILSEETRPATVRNDAGDDKLTRELAAADAALFEAVFNSSSPNALRTLLTDDFEFYHDRNGLVSETADAFVASIQRNREPGMQRRVIVDSVKVYPLQGFGALQEGMHEFYRAREGASPESLGAARFLHVWQRTDKGWKLKREFSYDHQES